MLGLREHVEGRDPFDPIDVVGAERLEVAGQRRRMARHVENLGRAGFPERVDERRGAADARGVGDDQGVVGGEPLKEGWHPLFSGASDEIPVGDPSLLLIEAGGLDGCLVDLNAGETLDEGRAFEGEETDAAVGVDQEAGAAVAHGGADGFHQGGEEVEVVLKEGILRELPSVRRDAEGDFDAALGRWFGADGDELFVQGGFGDGAMVDVDDEAIVVADEAHDELLGELVPLTAHHDPVAIRVGRRAGHDGIDAEIGETAKALEQIENLVVLDPELGGVGDVLVLAAAAVAVEAANGLGTLRRGLKNLDDFGACEVLLGFREFDEQAFAGNAERGENDEIVDATDRITTVRDGIDGEFEPVSDGVRGFALHEFQGGGVNLETAGGTTEISCPVP